MILKQIDDKSQELKTLKTLLKQSVSQKQKLLIKQDIAKVENGYKAEKDNAYYLDSRLKNSKTIVVLHDIRLEDDDNSAQFDHILVSRIGIIILESKSFTGDLTIKNDNSLSVKYGGKTKTFPNPIAQNIRHKEFLEQFLLKHFEFNKRIAWFEGIRIEHKVLFDTKTNITNDKLPDGFVRADNFLDERWAELEKDNFGKVLKKVFKIMSEDKMKNLANIIKENHQPKAFDYKKKYKISNKNTSVAEKVGMKKALKNDTKFCPRCQKGTLTLRKSNKNNKKYESQEFFGCSLYPKCRYIQKSV